MGKEERLSAAEPLDMDEVRRRVEAAQEAHAAQDAARLAEQYRIIQPLAEAANRFIRQVQDDDRLYLGLAGVDKLTRGHSRGDLVFFTGRPASGKTQVLLNAVNNNSDKHVVIFTPDESPELVLSKLVSIKYTIAAEQLESRIVANDPEALKLVRHVAATDFSKLIVVDETLSITDMGHAIDEAEDYWGERVDAVVYDFLELFAQGESSMGSVSQAAKTFKRFAKKVGAPLFCVHQGKKGDGNRGEAQGMDGMKYAGEAEALCVLEVFRRRENSKLTDYEKAGHANTVTVNVAKNKRPPSRTGEVDLYMNPDTGHVRALSSTDLIRDGAPTTDPAAILRAQQRGNQ